MPGSVVVPGDVEITQSLDDNPYIFGVVCTPYKISNVKVSKFFAQDSMVSSQTQFWTSLGFLIPTGVGLLGVFQFISERRRPKRPRFLGINRLLESSRGEQISTACPKTSVFCMYLYAGKLSAKFSQICP